MPRAVRTGRQQAVRMGKWKGCRENGPGNPVELYNLESDRVELNDIAEDHPEIVQKIEAIMAEEHEPHRLWNYTDDWHSANKSKNAKKAERVMAEKEKFRLEVENELRQTAR
jgi:arylsulfatase A-like enzyme